MHLNATYTFHSSISILKNTHAPVPDGGEEQHAGLQLGDGGVQGVSSLHGAAQRQLPAREVDAEGRK